MTIDIHAHLYPEAYVRTLRALGGPSSILADSVEDGNHRSPFMAGAVEERLALLDDAKIDRQVLSITGQAVLVEDAAHCRDHAAAANDVLAEVCARYPGRFSFWAALPLVDPDAALRELERAVDQLGALGVLLPTHVLGRPLDWPALDPLYAALDRRGLPALLHPGAPWQPVTPPGYPELGLTSGLYYPVEDANALLRLVCGGVLERFPGLRVICPHLGGPVPFLLYRLDFHTQPRLPDGTPLPYPPSYYLKQVLYDTVSQHPPALRCACETFGPSHLVLGTDFPYVGPAGVRATVATIHALGLEDRERDGILETNIRPWLRL